MKEIYTVFYTIQYTKYTVQQNKYKYINVPWNGIVDNHSVKML